jgi:hypothetical protein
MKTEKAMSSAKENKRLNVAIVNTPATLRKISDAIARRAYEIYKDRGDAPGDEKKDWRIAESQVLVPLCCGILELENGVLIETDISNLRCHEINLCIEPRRLVIIGKAPVAGNGAGVATFRVLSLPTAVDPSTATIKQRGPILEIELHEPSPAKESKCFEEAA